VARQRVVRRPSDINKLADTGGAVVWGQRFAGLLVIEKMRFFDANLRRHLGQMIFSGARSTRHCLRPARHWRAVDLVLTLRDRRSFGKATQVGVATGKIVADCSLALMDDLEVNVSLCHGWAKGRLVLVEDGRSMTTTNWFKGVETSDRTDPAGGWSAHTPSPRSLNSPSASDGRRRSEPIVDAALSQRTVPGAQRSGGEGARRNAPGPAKRFVLSHPRTDQGLPLRYN
jgi:hypothetical protein